MISIYFRGIWYLFICFEVADLWCVPPEGALHHSLSFTVHSPSFQRGTHPRLLCALPHSAPLPPCGLTVSCAHDNPLWAAHSSAAVGTTPHPDTQNKTYGHNLLQLPHLCVHLWLFTAGISVYLLGRSSGWKRYNSFSWLRVKCLWICCWSRTRDDKDCLATCRS